jgi:outer membrane protein assembly factor BamB
MTVDSGASGRRFARAAGFAVTAAAACFWGVVLAAWFTSPPPFPVTEDRPGRDQRPADAKPAGAGETRIGEFFQRYSGAPGADRGAWPGFRGPRHDNISRPSLTLSPSFPVAPRWSVPLGEGHGAPAVDRGRVFVLDYDEARRCDALRCLSADTGEEIWRRFYSAPLKRNHGFSRSIPAVSGGYVVSMGPRGHVMCVKETTGDLVWGLDVAREYGAEIPQWYAAQCPLVDGNEAVIAVAGNVFMIGVDLATGRVAWSTPRAAGLSLGHSSVVPMTYAGRRLYLYSAPGGLAGVSAEPADRGKLLFVHKAWDNAVVAPSAVPFPDGRVFLTAGYGGGSMMVRVTRSGDTYRTETLYRYRPREGLACEQQTPILHDGLLYGIMPKDAGDYKSQFVCFDPDAPRILWTTGKTLTFGLGPFLLADGKFLILDETGTLYALAADRAGFRVLGRRDVIPDARDAWGPLALTGQRLFLRDSTRLLALDVQ